MSVKSRTGSLLNGFLVIRIYFISAMGSAVSEMQAMMSAEIIISNIAITMGHAID